MKRTKPCRCVGDFNLMWLLFGLFMSEVTGLNLKLADSNLVADKPKSGCGNHGLALKNVASMRLLRYD